MNRTDAHKVIHAWLKSSLYRAPLEAFEDAEQDALLADLLARPYTVRDTPPAVVNSIFRRLFPKHPNFMSEKERANMYRGDSPKTQAAAPAPQTHEDFTSEFEKYIKSRHWESCLPDCPAPWKFVNGRIEVNNQSNYAVLFSALQKAKAEGRHLRSTDIMELVLNMRQQFERNPVVVKVAAEPPKPPSEREIHNSIMAKQKAMNDPSKAAIQGYGRKDDAADVLAEKKTNSLEEQAASEKAAADNATIREAQHLIQTYSAHSHSRTYSGRAQLEQTLRESLDAGLSADQCLQAVTAKIDQLCDNGSVR